MTGQSADYGPGGPASDLPTALRAPPAAEMDPAVLWDLIDSLRDPHVLLAPVRLASGQIADFEIAAANAAACACNRLPHDELVGMRLLDLHPYTISSGLFARYVGVVETGEQIELDDVVDQQDLLGREERTYEVHAARVHGMVSQTWRDVTDVRTASQRVASWRDVQATHDAQAALAATEARLRLVVENTLDLVFSLDMHAFIDWISPSVETLLGYQDTELIGSFSGPLINPADLPGLLASADRARAGEPASCRVRMVAKDGHDVWVEITPRPVYDDDRDVVGGVMAVRSIDAEVRLGQALERELAFDSLTGLAKAGPALERIAGILDRRTDDRWALLCVGVHGLTAINQAYTYVAGDAVLREVAVRLVAAAGAHDRVARIAGDEFVVILDDLVSPAAAADAAERLLAAVTGPVDVDGNLLEVFACVGIATARPGQVDAAALLRDATAALKSAAARGPGRWEFADEDIAIRTRADLVLQADLRAALAHHRIQAWFMPIADLTTGTVVGYEALARWVQRDGSVIHPDRFLSIAERTGLIREIDRLVLARSLDVLAMAPDAIGMSVNVSAASLGAGGLAEIVRTDLARTGIAPLRLSLEVTETALLDITPAVAQTMTDIAGSGVRWWVDDFGTGFSSVSHLRDRPITGLKLDRGFAAELKDNPRAMALARGLQGLAEGLRLTTVAEGVATTEQARLLRGMGWQLGQGWLYGEASPAISPVGDRADGTPTPTG